MAEVVVEVEVGVVVGADDSMNDTFSIMDHRYYSQH